MQKLKQTCVYSGFLATCFSFAALVRSLPSSSLHLSPFEVVAKLNIYGRGQKSLTHFPANRSFIDSSWVERAIKGKEQETNQKSNCRTHNTSRDGNFLVYVWVRGGERAENEKKEVLAYSKSWVFWKLTTKLIRKCEEEKTMRRWESWAAQKVLTCAVGRTRTYAPRGNLISSQTP